MLHTFLNVYLFCITQHVCIPVFSFLFFDFQCHITFGCRVNRETYESMHSVCVGVCVSVCVSVCVCVCVLEHV